MSSETAPLSKGLLSFLDILSCKISLLISMNIDTPELFIIDIFSLKQGVPPPVDKIKLLLLSIISFRVLVSIFLKNFSSQPQPHRWVVLAQLYHL